MKKIKKFRPAPALLALMLPIAAYAQNFLSQSYVDTTVMRALYVLNEASAYSGMSGTKQGHAVTQAESILNSLKERAKTDPNRNYILMKVQEVEAQIYWEKEEMRRIAADKKILTANQIVLQYNGEVGKMRPDFALLKELFRRMAEVDTRQANNLADSYNKRYRQISRDAMLSLEKALVANDYDQARRELEYCEKNKFYLMISSSQLETQRERLEGIQNAGSDMPKIKAQLDNGEAAYKAWNLSECRTNVTMARDRLNEIRAYLPPKESAELAARADRLLKDLDNREDSLVRMAISVLEKQGPETATSYLQNELQKKHNISYNRASFIDQAIMNSTPERAIEAKMKVQMVENNPDEPDNNYAMILDIQDKARYKAQEKADSVRMVREKANNISINIYTLLEHNKNKDAGKLFAREKDFLKSVLEKHAYEMLDMSVTHSTTNAGTVAGLNKNQQKAQQVTATIYGLLENNKIKEAYSRFQKNKKPLSRHLDSETYEMLEFTVVQSYNYVSKKK